MGWIEGEGWLDSLVGLRESVLQRDYRLLYLAWLKGVTLADDVDEEVQEPPIPPGLRTLSPALESFIELFDLDEDLLQVAAELSAARDEGISDDDLRRALVRLTADERDAFLLRLAKGEPHLSLALNHRLGVLGGMPQGETAKRRTVGALFAAAEALRQDRRRSTRLWPRPGAWRSWWSSPGKRIRLGARSTCHSAIPRQRPTLRLWGS